MNYQFSTVAADPLGMAESQGLKAVVSLQGDLDLFATRELRERLLGLIEEGHQHVVVDLGDVEFCDSSGLGVLVAAHRRMMARHGELEVAHARPAVRHLFEVSGLDQVLHLC